MGFACGSGGERQVQESGVKSDLRSDVGSDEHRGQRRRRWKSSTGRLALHRHLVQLLLVGDHLRRQHCGQAFNNLVFSFQYPPRVCLQTGKKSLV